MKAYGGVAVHFHTFLTSALDIRVFSHFTPGKKKQISIKGVAMWSSEQTWKFREGKLFFSPEIKM
jgi:hypothetical protein